MTLVYFALFGVFAWCVGFMFGLATGYDWGKHG